ncbi:MAG: hypothetical protein AAFS10_15110, partial [Myxococcota bacterium]
MQIRYRTLDLLESVYREGTVRDFSWIADLNLPMLPMDRLIQAQTSISTAAGTAAGADAAGGGSNMILIAVVVVVVAVVFLVLAFRAMQSPSDTADTTEPDKPTPRKVEPKADGDGAERTKPTVDPLANRQTVEKPSEISSTDTLSDIKRIKAERVQVNSYEEALLLFDAACFARLQVLARLF